MLDNISLGGWNLLGHFNILFLELLIELKLLRVEILFIGVVVLFIFNNNPKVEHSQG